MLLESGFDGGGGGFIGVGWGLLERGEGTVGVPDTEEVFDEMEESLCIGDGVGGGGIFGEICMGLEGLVSGDRRGVEVVEEGFVFKFVGG